jgi:hypothetical protein
MPLLLKLENLFYLTFQNEPIAKTYLPDQSVSEANRVLQNALILRLKVLYGDWI